MHRRNPLAQRPPMRLRAHSGLRGIAQLVEHRSPKPRVAGSNPAAPAIVSMAWPDRRRFGQDAKRRMLSRSAGSSGGANQMRSEEHTSELQSLMRISSAVFCLKQKNISQQQHENTDI